MSKERLRRRFLLAQDVQIESKVPVNDSKPAAQAQLFLGKRQRDVGVDSETPGLAEDPLRGKICGRVQASLSSLTVVAPHGTGLRICSDGYSKRSKGRKQRRGKPRPEKIESVSPVGGFNAHGLGEVSQSGNLSGSMQPTLSPHVVVAPLDMGLRACEVENCINAKGRLHRRDLLVRKNESGISIILSLLLNLGLFKCVDWLTWQAQTRFYPQLPCHDGAPVRGLHRSR